LWFPGNSDNHDDNDGNMDIDRRALEQWQKEQPLCILQLDAADRTVLKVAGRTPPPF
jgi:hypothetical protein